MLRWLSGDDSRLTFLILASIRSHLLRQPLLTLLTTLVVALSVALVIALALSSRSVQATLAKSAEGLRGHVDLEITAGSVGVPERLLDDVSSLPGVATAAPVIEAVVRLAGGPKGGLPLRILGIDLLADQSVRSYSMIQSDLRVLDPLRMVASTDSVIVSEILAGQLGISEGDTFRVHSIHGEHSLVVRGLLRSGGVGDAYAGQVVVMDVYALQALLGREGWLDRIDLLLAPDGSSETTQAVAARIAGIASLRRPDIGDRFLGGAISTLTFSAAVIALSGTLVAGLLCYAALAASVDRRTRLFALLRAAGLEATRVRRFVYLDSLPIALSGVALGVPLGSLLSRVFAVLFSNTSSFTSGIQIESAKMSAQVLLLGVGVGVGLSLVGAALGARRSTRLAPHEAVASGRGLVTNSPGPQSARALFAGAVLLAVWITAVVRPPAIPAIYRAALVFILGMTLVWTLLGPLLGRLLSSVRIGLERAAPGIGRVAAASLTMRLNQTRISAASITAIVATVSSLWVVTTSVFDSVDRYSSSRGGAMITASNFFQSRSLDPLLEETVSAVEKTPGVGTVFRHFATDTIYRGENVRLSAIAARVWADRVGFDLIERSGNDAEMARALESGGVFVYDSFQRHFGVGIGDSIRLDTPHGSHDFPIIGVRRVYTVSPIGGIQMDLSTFDRYWHRPGLSNIFVWPSGDEQKVLDSIQTTAGNRQPLFTVRSADYERSMRSALDAYRTPIQLLVGLVVLLAGAAVANLMIALAVERGGDFALLEAIGASRAQLVGLVVIETSSLGAVAAIAGLVLGFACAGSLRNLVTDQLGWLVSWSIRPVELALLALGTIGLSALVGLVTGVRASRRISWIRLAPE